METECLWGHRIECAEFIPIYCFFSSGAAAMQGQSVSTKPRWVGGFLMMVTIQIAKAKRSEEFWVMFRLNAEIEHLYQLSYKALACTPPTEAAFDAKDLH